VLQGSAIDAFWLGIAFLAAAATFMPLFSTFSEIFGRKIMLVIALTLFTTGAFVCAMTNSFTGLHLGRALQGCGAGGLFLLSDLITSDLVSPLDKRRWSASIGAM
jgi:MFS family permease